MTGTEVVLSLAGNVFSFATDTVLGGIYNRVRALIEEGRMRVSSREFLEYLFENRKYDYSSFVSVLRKADNAPSFETLKEDVTSEVSAVLDTREYIPSYVDVVLLYAASRSDKVKVWVDGYFGKRKAAAEKNEAEVERNRFLIELGNLFNEMFHSGDFFSLDWFDENLILSTDGKLSLDFFSGLDAMFEGNLSDLIRKREYRTIEVHASDERLEAVYYILFVLRCSGVGDRVKVIRRRDVWDGKPSWSPGDILIADFEDYHGMTIHGGCMNIRVYDRDTPPDGNAPNYLILRHPSSLVLRNRLYGIFGPDSKRIQSLLDETNGNFSLLEAELTSHHLEHSWDGTEPGSAEFGALSDFLVVPRFTSSDFDVMKTAGLNAKWIADTARRIDRRKGCHLFYMTEKNGTVTYSLASPDRLWFYCRGKDDDFVSSFMDKALRLLSVKGVSCALVNGVVYTFIRHYADFELSRDDFFKNISPVLLRRNDRKDIMEALTELSPALMLRWFGCCPNEINSSNFNALALLMHDERYSGECIRLILSSYRNEDGYHFQSLGELIEEFFRAEVNTSGVSAGEVCDVLRDVKNPALIRDLIFDVLYREHSSFSLVYVYYRYRPSYAEKLVERKRKEFFTIEECEMKWFLENAGVPDLTEFVSKVDFVYFDVFDALGNTVERLKKTSPDREWSRLYIAFFNLYWNWYFNRWPQRNEILDKLKPVLDAAVPSGRELRLVPYFLYQCPHYDYILEQRADRNNFYMSVVPVVKKNGVTLGEYLQLSSYIDDYGDANWEDYIRVMFSVYGEEAVAGDVLGHLPETAGMVYVSLLCRDYSNRIDEVYDSLGDDCRYRFVCAAPYSAVKERIKELPDEMQDEYWSGRFNFHPGELDKEDKKHALDMLISHGNGHEACLLLECWCDDFSDGELCHFAFSLSGEEKGKHNSLYPEKALSRIRTYSDAGHIPFDTVMEWERKLLTNRELVKEDTFFIRSFRTSPEILCSILDYLYPSGDRDRRSYDSNEYADVSELYSLVNVCPGVDSRYYADYDALSSWVESFIAIMREQGQERIIPEGLGKVFSSSTRNFDDILPEAICRILENLDKRYRLDTIRSLTGAIQFRRGCFYVTGRGAADLSFRFREYAENLEKRGFSAASEVYSNLAMAFKNEDKCERDE